MQILERDFEDYLFEHPEKLGLQKIIGRQVHVPSGIIDLLGIHKNGFVCVVELKMEEPKPEHLTQVCRYAADLESAIYDFPSVLHNETPKVMKMLVYIGDIPGAKIFSEAIALSVGLYRVKSIFDCDVSENLLYTCSYADEDDREKKEDAVKDLLRPIFIQKHEKMICQYNEMIEPFKLLFTEYISDENWLAFYQFNLKQNGYNFCVFNVLKTILDKIGKEKLLELFEKFYPSQHEYILYENTIDWWNFKVFCEVMIFDEKEVKNG